MCPVYGGTVAAGYDRSGATDRGRGERDSGAGGVWQMVGLVGRATGRHDGGILAGRWGSIGAGGGELGGLARAFRGLYIR